MAFNSDTYQRNKARRLALESLAAARRWRNRSRSAAWPSERIPALEMARQEVRAARMSWRIYLLYRRLDAP